MSATIPAASSILDAGTPVADDTIYDRAVKAAQGGDTGGKHAPEPATLDALANRALGLQLPHVGEPITEGWSEADGDGD